MARRIEVETPVHLTITLDGDPHERTAAYTALLADAVRAVEWVARRYLRKSRGEAITARLAEHCEVTELTPWPAGRRRDRGATTRAAEARTASPAGAPEQPKGPRAPGGHCTSSKAA